MIIIGIDPGKRGAIVALDVDGKIRGLRPTPVVDGEYQIMQMRADLQAAIDEGDRIASVFLERAHAFPLAAGGMHSQFSAGEGYGIWKAVACLSGATVWTVPASTWQGVYYSYRRKTSGPKEAAAAMCLEKWPSVTWTVGRSKKVHDGLADAACMAEFGRQWLAMPGPQRARVKLEMVV